MCALVTGVQTCALPISLATVSRGFLALMVLVLASPAWAASTADAPLAPVLEPLLAGEFYLQQGAYPRAAAQSLVAAQQSSDPAVARRATAAPLASNQPQRHEAAMARWQAAEPDPPGLLDARTSLALRPADAAPVQQGRAARRERAG